MVQKYIFNTLQKKAQHSTCVLCNKCFSDIDILKNQFVFVKSHSGKDQFIHMHCFMNECRG